VTGATRLPAGGYVALGPDITGPYIGRFPADQPFRAGRYARHHPNRDASDGTRRADSIRCPCEHPVVAAKREAVRVHTHVRGGELHTAASQPKTILWYAAGHGLNQQAGIDRFDWLREQIGLDLTVVAAWAVGGVIGRMPNAATRNSVASWATRGCGARGRTRAVVSLRWPFVPTQVGERLTQGASRFSCPDSDHCGGRRAWQAQASSGRGRTDAPVAVALANAGATRFHRSSPERSARRRFAPLAGCVIASSGAPIRPCRLATPAMPSRGVVPSRTVQHTRPPNARMVSYTSSGHGNRGGTSTQRPCFGCTTHFTGCSFNALRPFLR
jgi:hypothetical protein